MVAAELCLAVGNRWALNRACAMIGVTGRARYSRSLKISLSMGSVRKVGFQWPSGSVHNAGGW